MKRQNLRTVSLIVVTFTYLLIGAAIFGYLESEHEVRQREQVDWMEKRVRWKYNISEDDYTVLTTAIIKSVPHKAGIQWKFPGAFYFATTVVTTIGYGHSTPSTMAGRSFCMVYALIGIPLGLVMFQSIGERLNTFVGSALRYAKRCFKTKNPEVTQTNLVMVVLVLSTILMTSMAAIFAKYERWEYFDALYYCFITLTTIGFGDYVALQKESALQSKPEYVALSLIFILFGLSVVSSAVNLLVLKFLTLNTEDERRDEQIRSTAALDPFELKGVEITMNASKQQLAARAKRQAAQAAALTAAAAAAASNANVAHDQLPGAGFSSDGGTSNGLGPTAHTLRKRQQSSLVLSGGGDDGNSLSMRSCGGGGRCDERPLPVGEEAALSSEEESLAGELVVAAAKQQQQHLARQECCPTSLDGSDRMQLARYRPMAASAHAALALANCDSPGEPAWCPICRCHQAGAQRHGACCVHRNCANHNHSHQRQRHNKTPRASRRQLVAIKRPLGRAQGQQQLQANEQLPPPPPTASRSQQSFSARQQQIPAYESRRHVDASDGRISMANCQLEDEDSPGDSQELRDLRGGGKQLVALDYDGDSASQMSSASSENRHDCEWPSTSWQRRRHRKRQPSSLIKTFNDESCDLHEPERQDDICHHQHEWRAHNQPAPRKHPNSNYRHCEQHARLEEHLHHRHRWQRVEHGGQVRSLSSVQIKPLSDSNNEDEDDDCDEEMLRFAANANDLSDLARRSGATTPFNCDSNQSSIARGARPSTSSSSRQPMGVAGWQHQMNDSSCCSCLSHSLQRNRPDQRRGHNHKHDQDEWQWQTRQRARHQHPLAACNLTSDVTPSAASSQLLLDASSLQQQQQQQVLATNLRTRNRRPLGSTTTKSYGRQSTFTGGTIPLRATAHEQHQHSAISLVAQYRDLNDLHTIEPKSVQRRPTNGQSTAKSADDLTSATRSLVPKLICKCCCQHDECIRYALAQSSGGQKQVPLSAGESSGHFRSESVSGRTSESQQVDEASESMQTKAQSSQEHDL